MAKKRPDRRGESAAKIKLAQPDHSGPSEKTLLQLAEERGLFAETATETERRQHEAGSGDNGKGSSSISGSYIPTQISRARRRHPKNFMDMDMDGGGSKDKWGDSAEAVEDDDEMMSPLVERILETLLYTFTMTVLHVTLDVLVQNQFSIDSVVWAKVMSRAGQAFLVFGLLMYVLHPHRPGPFTLLPAVPERYKTAGRQLLFFATSICAGCYLVYISNTFGYLAIMKQAPPLGCLWVWAVIELDLRWALLSVSAVAGFLWTQGYSFM